MVTKPGDLVELVDSEARVMLLYCTREEAIDILTRAADLKLTGENYVWVVTQSVIENLQTPAQFPVGMLGKSYKFSLGYKCGEMMQLSLRTYMHVLDERERRDILIVIVNRNLSMIFGIKCNLFYS